MTQKYEWLGDRGEIYGAAVFMSRSQAEVNGEQVHADAAGRLIVELPAAAADAAIEGGFPLRKYEATIKAGKKVTPDAIV